MIESALFIQIVGIFSAVLYLLSLIFGAFFTIVGSFILYDVAKDYILKIKKQREKRKITILYNKNNKK